MKIDLISKLANRKLQPPYNSTMKEDGIWYCNTCGEAKSCFIDYQGKRLELPCSCSCNKPYDFATEKKMQEKARRTALAFTDPKSASQTFSASDGIYGSEELRVCELWIGKLPDGLKNPDYPRGLLLFGAPDAGKTFAANCIANVALDKGMRVISRSIPWLLAQDIKERPFIVRQMIEAELLILDDLGAERGTDYAKEIVYTVIDERYKNGSLTVVTTNLTNSELADASDLRDRRAYNRLLEFSYPVRFDTGRKRLNATSIAAMKAAINS